MAELTIDRVVTLTTTVGGDGSDVAPWQLVSLGIVVGDFISWAECVLPSEIQPVIGRANFGERLGAAATALLSGIPADEFRPTARLVAESRDAMMSIAGIRAGVEQALLEVVAWAIGRRPAEVLRREYDLPSAPSRPRLIAEIRHDVGTFELFSRALAHQPDGIGYRLEADDVVDLVGPDAAELLRFTRELTDYAGDAAALSVYLAVRGALGELAGDPRRNLERVANLVLALERAAGQKPLQIEDPFITADGTTQVALMLQLRERLKAAGSGVGLVAAAGMDDGATVGLAGEARAVDGVVVRPTGWGSIEEIMALARKCTQRGLGLTIAPQSRATWNSVRHAADIAVATGAEALLLSIGEGNADMIRDTALHLARGRVA